MSLFFSRRGDPPCAGFRLRLRDRVPLEAGGGVPLPAEPDQRGPVQEEGARPRYQVSICGIKGAKNGAQAQIYAFRRR